MGEGVNNFFFKAGVGRRGQELDKCSTLFHAYM